MLVRSSPHTTYDITPLKGIIYLILHSIQPRSLRMIRSLFSTDEPECDRPISAESVKSPTTSVSSRTPALATTCHYLVSTESLPSPTVYPPFFINLHFSENIRKHTKTSSTAFSMSKRVDKVGLKCRVYEIFRVSNHQCVFYDASGSTVYCKSKPQFA